MMKKFFILFAIPLSLFMTSCGGDGETAVDEAVEEQEEAVNPLIKDMIQVDLTDYGLPLLITIPDTLNAPLTITTQDWGETEIMVGKNFQIRIAEGGDMELRKADLADDLLFTKVEYIIDEANGISYKQSKADDEHFPAQFHFYVVKNIKGIDYEIQDIVGNTSFTDRAVERMFLATQALEASARVS